MSATERLRDGSGDGWDAFMDAERDGTELHYQHYDDADYNDGWWYGVSAAECWTRGFKAAEKGVQSHIFISDEDREWKEWWLKGYWAAQTIGLDKEYSA